MRAYKVIGIGVTRFCGQVPRIFEGKFEVVKRTRLIQVPEMWYREGRVRNPTGI